MYGPGGYTPGGYGPGYRPNGYGPNGYGQGGYNPNGYDPNRWDPKGYNPRGYNGPRPDGFDFYDRGPKEDSSKDYNNKNRYNGNKGDDEKRSGKIWIIILAAIMTIFLVYFMSSAFQNATSKEITYDEYLEMINSGKAEKVVVTNSGKIVITPKETEVTGGNGLSTKGIAFTYWTTALSGDALLDELKAAHEQHGLSYKIEQSDTQTGIIDILLAYVVPFALIYFFMGMIFKRMGKGGAMGVGKSTAKMYMQKETGVTFKDVAGQDEAKESLKEIVDFLHNPGKYSKIGAKLPKGALLVGPPGTGKTLLAKAVAGEANVPFFSLSGSDFVELYVGVGVSRVRDLFKTAQQNAPCIIFIDGIDAIGKSRDSKYGGGNDEREQTLNQLLSEMDGFDSSKGLFILAATNRPDVLDKALLRPGRFDRRIIVDKPDLKGRVDVLKVHSKGVAMDETVDLDAIGLATSGAVGSDLANMINEAAINAVKQGRAAISQADLLESVEVVIAGKEKKDRILNATEKKTVAYHEVGHALITALIKNAEPVQKITIVPRTMGSLGYVMQVPEEEKYLMTKDELLTRITTLLGGRAAEEITFDTVTTGASNDMEKATELARAMITQYGMSDEFGLMSLEKVEDTYLAGRTVLNCSDETASQIDREVKALLKDCFDRAKTLLSENKEILAKVADYLYEHETITGKEFMEVAGLEVTSKTEKDDSETSDSETSESVEE
ncbi:MAG: ATP-dependent zinc metalloprotease FtsH [Lachnospiraceae bacterium]|nr:ATP-dependent zinc metalloprotease FtsH [Lachnospiraceae bacterium]